MIDLNALNKIREQVASTGREITLVGATKTQSKAIVDEFMSIAPDFVLGENRVQELLDKYDSAYRWHFIGRLQRNKVKYIIDVCDLDNHMFYFVVYADKYNDTFLYFGTEQMENSDICITFSPDYFKSHTTHTICNSIINKPVWVTPLSNRVKFLDRNARKLYFDLKNEGKLY